MSPSTSMSNAKLPFGIILGKFVSTSSITQFTGGATGPRTGNSVGAWHVEVGGGGAGGGVAGGGEVAAGPPDPPPPQATRISRKQ